MSQNIWKTLEKAKKRQEEIRGRIRSVDGDDDVLADLDDNNNDAHRRSSNLTSTSKTSSSAGGATNLTIDAQRQEQAPSKPKPPPTSFDDRPVEHDDDSEPDYYGYLFKDDDKEDDTPKTGQKQEQRGSGTAMTAAEAIQLALILKQADDAKEQADKQQQKLTKQQQKEQQKKKDEQQRKQQQQQATAVATPPKKQVLQQKDTPRKNKPPPPPPRPQPMEDEDNDDDDDDDEPDYYGLNDPQPTKGTPKGGIEKRGSQEALSPEEAIKLVLGSSSRNSGSRGSDDEEQDEDDEEEQPQEEDEPEEEDEDDDDAEHQRWLQQHQRHEVDVEEGEEAPYQDDEGAYEGVDYNDDENPKIYAEQSSKSMTPEEAFDKAKSSNKNQNNKDERKWKKSAAKKGKGKNENGSKSRKSNGGPEWGNISDLSFATTTQQYEDSDGDDEFYDALQELDGESVTQTSRKASYANLAGVREEEEDDEAGDELKSLPAKKASSPNNGTGTPAGNSSGWGSKISHLAFSVGSSVLTVAAAVATGGGEAKKSGDEEEGGEKATSPRATTRTSMFGSLTSSMTSATTAASSLFTSVGNTISGTAETGSAAGADEGSAGGFFRKKPKNPPKKDAAPSRELEIIRKCQEQMKLMELTDKQKRANAAKVDAENLRLEKAEQEARDVVQAEVERFRVTMIEMGNEDKLAKLGKSAAEEYDDRLALEDTLKEQQAKAALMEQGMKELDTGKDKKKAKDKYLDGNEGSEHGGDDNDSEAGGEKSRCCYCIKKIICYGLILVLLAVLVAIPLYFTTDVLGKVPLLKALPEWKGRDDKGSNDVTSAPTMFPTLETTATRKVSPIVNTPFPTLLPPTTVSATASPSTASPTVSAEPTLFPTGSPAPTPSLESNV